MTSSKKKSGHPDGLKKISYDDDLNAKQKANYNFQEVAAFLADYGFNCIRLS